MQSRRILVSWIGYTDLRAMAQDEQALTEPQRKKILKDLRTTPAPDGTGPVKTLVDQESFDEIHLISNDVPGRSKLFAKWLGGNTRVHNVQLDDPTDYGAIFSVVDAVLKALLAGRRQPGTELCFHLSPGTPAMAAIWVLLGKSRYPATLYQTYKTRASVTEIPFDVVVDLVPELLREPDTQIQHLISQRPSEIAGFEQIIGDSKVMRLAVGRARQAAIRAVPVLILGETGTGKEMLAKGIHLASPRRGGPFRAINCAAIPEPLLESELFGHKKGAFTQASENRLGVIEAADGGTLFLDEVGECSPAMQVKLLRVLQPIAGEHPCHHVFYRVGDPRPRTSNVRIVTATNRDLLTEVGRKNFREDLYYRLAVVTVKLPPLRHRTADIPLIAESLLAQINIQFGNDEPGYEHKTISATALRFMKRHAWPGNVRELFNVLLQAAVMSAGHEIQQSDIKAAIAQMPGQPPVGVLDHELGDGFDLDKLLAGIQKHYLRRAMEQAQGKKTHAAKLLGYRHYQTLGAQLDQLNVSWDIPPST